MSKVAWTALIASAACVALVLLRRRRRANGRHLVTVIDSASVLDAALTRWHRTHSVLGLDVEWVAGSRPAALLQLSCGDETVVVQLSKLAPPEALLRLLADPQTSKVGVGVAQDLRRLETWANTGVDACSSRRLSCGGGVDLIPIAVRCGCAGRSLASLSEELLGERMHKGAVRRSNWEVDTLSVEQVAYAANDARASLRVYLALLARLDWWPRTSPTVAAPSLPPRRSTDAAAARGRCVRIPTRSQPVYDGWLMLDPSGQPMCRMAAKRGRWYLAKGLASLLPEEDLLAAQAPGRTIRLHFEPGGPGNAAEPWLLAGKRNACVGCGGEAGGGGEGRGGDGSRCGADGAAARLVRFSVVPHAFRRHLPDDMKSRDSHDLVVLCVGCYGVLEPAYERHRQHLYRRHGVSRSPAPRRQALGQEEVKVRSAALALSSHHCARIPAGRRAELEAVVASALGVEPGHVTRDNGRRLGAAACARATASGARLAVARGAADARRPLLAGRRQRRRRRRRRRRWGGHAPRLCARVAGGLL